MISEVKGYIQNIYNDFSNLSNLDKAKVIVKTTFVATAVGLIAGLGLSGFTSVGAGLLSGAQVFKLSVSQYADRTRENRDIIEKKIIDIFGKNLIDSDKPKITSTVAKINSI